ncbi:MAG: Hsp70 family protein [Thermoguttaceae bacterium]
MAGAVAVGIDLGTTNSAAAWVEPSGRTAMLRNAEGDILTPSAVFFDDAAVIVGKQARRVASLYPDRVAQAVKRDMGLPVYSRPIRGQHLPPEVIQACILRKLRADIAATVGPAAKVVLTVPAYFDEPRRKATADAGEMAGLTLLDIVNEPTAAALGFGEAVGYLSPTGKLLEEMTVMVYDLGGGTFDATLLRLAPGRVQTLATDGDVQLGGYDWDMRLVDYAVEVFRQAGGRDPRDDPAAFSRLYEAAVEAKHTLSARTRATIRIDYAGLSVEVPLTREQFEQMTADLLERTAFTSRQLLAAAGLDWSDVSRILLVGGSTRMPMVPRMLREMTGLMPDRTVNPDEAVARGAALYAHNLLSSPERGGPGAAFRVVNVNSHSLGVEGIDAATLRRINVILIPRNTPLPAKRTEKFATKAEGQRSIVIQVLEGESSLPDQCAAIGRTVIRDLPAGLPKGWPIEVTFEYGTNGRLSVHGVVPGTARQVTLELERDMGLSREGLSRWRRVVDSAAGFERFEATVAEVLSLPAIGGRGPGAGLGAQAEGVDGALEGGWDLGPHAAPPAPPTSDSSGVLEPPVPIQSQPTPVFVHPVPLPAQLQEGPARGKATSRSASDQPVPVGPAASGPASAAGAPAGTFLADASLPGPLEKPVVPRWLVTAVGYAISAVAGLAVGYYLVTWLVPGARMPKLW